MKASTDLFDLIQSLSPNEKRYFKRFASQHVIGSQNNYLRLFEAIGKQKTYDEDALRERFKGERFIEHLPSEKNYLFQMVLKAMRRYQADKSVDIKLRDMLLDAEFLNSRGLYKASGKILKKAGDLARQYERWPSLVDILFRKKDMLVKAGHKALEGEIAKAIGETEAAMEAFGMQVHNHDVYYRLLVHTRIRYHQRDQRATEQLEALAAQVQGPGNAPHFFTSLKHHHIQALLHQLKGESGAAADQFQAADGLWNSRPDLLKAHLQLYTANLANLLSTLHFAGRYSDMAPHLTRLRKLKARTWDEEGERLQNLVFYESLHKMSLGDFAGLKQREAEALSLLKRFSTKVNVARKVSLAYNLMVSFFIVEDFKKALEWAHRLLEEFAKEQRKDAQVIARLIQLLIYFDRRDLDLVESQCRSIKRKLKKEDTLLPLERRVLDFTQRWVDGRLEDGSHAWLLKRLQEEEVHPKAPGKGELEIWCRARMEGRSMKEVAREVLAP